MFGRDDQDRMTRREALRLMGMGGGAGWLASVGALSFPLPLRAGPAREAGAGRTVPQQTPIVRTLSGDLPGEAVPDGAVLFHEHLSMRYPIGSESSFSDDVDLMIREVGIAGSEGVGTIVDAGHPDMARDLEALRRIDAESGVRVVASGGYYMQSTYPPQISDKSDEQVADDLVAEALRDGLGALGEIGQQGGVLTPDERKVHRAVAMAHVRTGLPVFTHNEYSLRATDIPRDSALRQLEIYQEAGANLANVCIGHVCCLDDPAADVAIEIAQSGAYVGFDRVTLNFTMPDERRVDMAMALIEAGHADKLLLASDFFAAFQLQSEGGNGIAQTVTVFAPMLRAAGVDDATVRMILEENPRRFLSFVPRG